MKISLDSGSCTADVHLPVGGITHLAGRCSFRVVYSLHFCIHSGFIVFSNGSATSQSEGGDGQAAERAGTTGAREAGLVYDNDF